MNFMRETEQYYDWLYKIVCGEWEPRNLSFHRLLMYLFNRDYIPACEMDVSLGLAAMDDTRFSEERAEPILARFMDRDYEPNGAGGLFTITRTSIDMRTIDIWYQLMSWLNENEF